MDFQKIVLQGFDGREEALSKIKRYIHGNTKIMYYRTNDFMHSQRVLWHLEEALPKIQSVYDNLFDIGFARTLALVHDDAEIITGDVQLCDKERMSDAEKKILAEQERNAITLLIGMYDLRANGYDYGELLIAAKEKKILEAQFVSFFDKLDGAGEAWHEIWAGNKYFLPAAGGSNGQGGYIRRLNEFPKKYPIMKNFFDRYPEYLTQSFDFKFITEHGSPHTTESLQKDSCYVSYERWKNTIMKREGIEKIVTKIEF